MEDFVRWYSPRDWIPCEESHDHSKASHDQSCSEDVDNNSDSNIVTNSDATNDIENVVTNNSNTTSDVTNNSNTTNDVTNNSNNTSGWDEDWAEIEETSSQSVASRATSITPCRVFSYCIV